MAIKKFISSEGQNIQDIVLQFYGSLEKTSDFLLLNPDFNFDSDIPAGTLLYIDDLLIGQKDIQQYKKETFSTNNSDEFYIPDDGNKLLQDGSEYMFQNGIGFEFN
jgi:hypothetical protein